MGRLLKSEEVAEMLGLSVQHLARLRCEGGGPQFVKLGHSSVRYRPADIEDWLAAHEKTSTSDTGAAV